MPPITPDSPVPNCLKVRIAGTDGGGNVWNNLEYFIYSGSAPSNAVCQTLAADIGGVWKTNFLPNLPPPLTYEETTVTDLTSVTSGEGVAASSAVGTSTADKVPANVAVVISKIISARYRGGRPRTYSIVLADENLQDPSHISTAYASTMLTNYTNFISGVIGLSSGGTTINSHVAVSFRGHFGPPPQSQYVGTTDKLINPIVWPLGEYVVDLQLGSQRGRIGRRR